MKGNCKTRILYILAMAIVISLLFRVFAEDNRNVSVLPYIIEASSYLSQNDLRVIANYHPYYLVDNNPSTAWVEGVPGSGIKESVLMWIEIPQKTTIKIAIRNGFQKTEELFYKNNRIKELKVTFMLGDLYNPDYVSRIYTLEDKMGWQTIEFRTEKKCHNIAFTIHSIYKGTTYDDTCISDINISIDNDLGINKVLQNEIQIKYDLWYKERTEKSMFFKNLPADYPFRQYERTVYERIIPWDKFFALRDELYLNLYTTVYADTELKDFISSEEGKAYMNMLNSKFKEMGTSKDLEYTGVKIYRPEVLGEYIFTGIEEYLRFSNIKLANKTDSQKKICAIYESKFHANRLFIKDEYPYEDAFKIDEINYYYDNKGRLFFKMYKYRPAEGEICDNLMLVWQDGLINKIFYFYCEEHVDGVMTKMVIYK